MTKTKKNTIKKNRTYKKNKITIKRKTKFIHEILKQWKKQTKGAIEKDKTTIYEYDYYLSFDKIPNRNNHIHLALKDFHYNDNIHNNLIYIMKKYDINKSKIVHSQPIRINIFSEPAKIVNNMIIRYNKFI